EARLDEVLLVHFLHLQQVVERDVLQHLGGSDLGGGQLRQQLVDAGVDRQHALVRADELVGGRRLRQLQRHRRLGVRRVGRALGGVDVEVLGHLQLRRGGGVGHVAGRGGLDRGGGGRRLAAGGGGAAVALLVALLELVHARFPGQQVAAQQARVAIVLQR